MCLPWFSVFSTSNSFQIIVGISANALVLGHVVTNGHYVFKELHLLPNHNMLPEMFDSLFLSL